MNTYIDVTKIKEKTGKEYYDHCYWIIFTAVTYQDIEIGVNTGKALQVAGHITAEQLEQLEIMGKCERGWMGVQTHVLRLKRVFLIDAAKQLSELAEARVRANEDPREIIILRTDDMEAMKTMWQSGLISYLANYTTGRREGERLIFNVVEVDPDVPVDYHRILESSKQPCPPGFITLTLPATDAADTPKS